MRKQRRKYTLRWLITPEDSSSWEAGGMGDSTNDQNKRRVSIPFQNFWAGICGSYHSHYSFQDSLNKYSVLLDRGSTNKAGIKMIQQMKLLLRRGFDGEIISRRENNTKPILRRIFGNSRKHDRILTVHGNMAFDEYLLDAS